jgi:membrane associated rhomboid family serine protease
MSPYLMNDRYPMFPVVIKNLLIANVLVLLAQVSFEHSSAISLDNLFALHDLRSEFFKPHQLVTYMFMHGGFSHLLGNMLGLWVFGRVLEIHWGPKKFLIFYMVCGLGAAVLYLLVLYLQGPKLPPELFLYPADQQSLYLKEALNTPILGASGAVFGVIAGSAYLFPNDIIYINFFIPLRRVWLAVIYTGFEFVSFVQSLPGDNVAHAAHLGGALVGLVLVIYWNRTDRRRFW